MIAKLINWWQSKFRKDVIDLPEVHESARKTCLCDDVTRTLVTSGWITELSKVFPTNTTVRKTTTQQQSIGRATAVIRTDSRANEMFYVCVEVSLDNQPALWVRAAVLQHAEHIAVQVWAAENVSDRMYVMFDTFFEALCASKETFMSNTMPKPKSAEKSTKSTVVKLVSNRGHVDEPDPK